MICFLVDMFECVNTNFLVGCSVVVLLQSPRRNSSNKEQALLDNMAALITKERQLMELKLLEKVIH